MIVHKITDDINPEDVTATTYQMRNFYKQLAEGFFTGLDVMNCIQHVKMVDLMHKGDIILDVCCGRGLVLPMIRWYKRDIDEYIGVDISQTNINEQSRWCGTKKIMGLDHYPFKITQINANVANMSDHINKQVDLIIYTSSIEHMQKEDGIKSLAECYKLLKEGHRMMISCPNTTDKTDPYDTQYAAHLYEWNLKELSGELERIGFKIESVFGIYARKRKLDKLFEKDEMYKKYAAYLPTKFLCAFYPIIYPEIADEVMLICRK